MDEFLVPVSSDSVIRTAVQFDNRIGIVHLSLFDSQGNQIDISISSLGNEVIGINPPGSAGKLF